MRKFVLTILAVFYLGVDSEATVHFHYCMGELIDWSIFTDEAEKCSNCGMEKGNSKDCCKDQEQQITVKDSPKASAIVYYFNTLRLNIPTTVYSDPRIIYDDPIAINGVNSGSPPRTQATPVFIRNCTFRI